jgi:hypothetical protein
LSADVSSRSSRSRQRVPRGVIVLGLLFYIGAFVSIMAGLVIPMSKLVGQSRAMYILYGVLIGILATGLLRRRRWAWFSTLAFLVVNAYYVRVITPLDTASTVVSLSLIAFTAAYLLWPGVRAAFLQHNS